MNMLNIGKSGLLASAASLNATSNNVANAMVAGYSRQQVMTSSVGGGAYGGGAGVYVDGVRRISDQYEVAQLWKTNSDVGFSKIQTSYLGQAEQVFGADGNDISKGLGLVFAAMNSAMEQPNLIAHRQGIINETKALVQRVHSINESLSSQREQINGQLGSSVKLVNTQLDIISKFNKDIRAASAIGTVPAALQDGRDAAINELASLIDIRVVEDAQGLVNISLEKGEPLIAGNTKATLSTVPDPLNPANSNISIQFGKSQFVFENSVGGSMGSLMTYRDTQLANSQTYIDELAQHLANEFNNTLALGTDLSGAAPVKNFLSVNSVNPAGSLAISSGFTPEDLALGLDGTQGDNSNLKALAALASKSLGFTSLGGAVSLGESFSSIVGALGSASRQAKADAKTNTDLHTEAKSQWASTSGVNPDEEGVNLIVYQQAYQANAKVITTAERLFQTVLNSF
ncbi:Flagellar hook-associated protein [Shewanella denitrificans OS217]|jgi:flagellar hook-associated protein 1|uniref:Flagellar hook-associated protein 1 n=1 Tax=Shewanella denitrificans (strain OS217 / ATCC BAA-1090 / DSM 15013) TaxID=318161 RepID=Q12I09_SHEDO|nr:flagellar hook-associated protein FlgK [Shewanella denitrificans]ABE56917.1 Flagellar hook-associated protein [Shewanella denitrificans OS217]